MALYMCWEDRTLSQWIHNLQELRWGFHCFWSPCMCCANGNWITAVTRQPLSVGASGLLAWRPEQLSGSWWTTEDLPEQVRPCGGGRQYGGEVGRTGQGGGGIKPQKGWIWWWHMLPNSYPIPGLNCFLGSTWTCGSYQAGACPHWPTRPKGAYPRAKEHVPSLQGNLWRWKHLCRMQQRANQHCCILCGELQWHELPIVLHNRKCKGFVFCLTMSFHRLISKSPHDLKKRCSRSWNEIRPHYFSASLTFWWALIVPDGMLCV